MYSSFQVTRLQFARAIMTLTEFGDPAALHIEANDRPDFSERNRQRQADIAQPHYCDGLI